MTVKSRIARIRLSEKIAKNKEYADSIGVYVINGKMDEAEAEVQEHRDNNNFKKDGKDYEYKSRKISN